MKSTRAYLAVALVLLAIAYVYFPLVNAGFVYWDDHALFTDNADVARFHIWNFFTDLAPGGYFPLVRVSLAVDHLLFGYSALASHAINVGLHVLVVGLVFRAARVIFGLATVSAAIVAALFAVHPLAVEPVSWVSGGRKDLLCTLFYLITILLLARGRSGGAFASALTALLCKAIAVTLAPWAWLTRHRKFAYVLLPFAIGIGLIELVAQRTGLRLTSEGDTILGAVGRVFASLGFDLTRLVIPRGLAVYYDRRLIHLDVWDVLTLAGLAGAVGYALWRRDRHKLEALGFFLLTLAPTLKLVPFGQDGAFNDRYLYLPSLGLLVFLVRTIDLPKYWRALWLGPLIAFAMIAHAQTNAWRSQESLWLNVDAKYPGARKVAPNLALYYIQNGEYDKGLPFARRAVDDEPRDIEARSNLGVLLTRMGRPEEAHQALVEALRIEPDHPMLLNNLAWLYLEANDRKAARYYFEKALERAPDMINAREGLARANAP